MKTMAAGIKFREEMEVRITFREDDNRPGRFELLDENNI